MGKRGAGVMSYLKGPDTSPGLYEEGAGPAKQILAAIKPDGETDVRGITNADAGIKYLDALVKDASFSTVDDPAHEFLEVLGRYKTAEKGDIIPSTEHQATSPKGLDLIPQAKTRLETLYTQRNPKTSPVVVPKKTNTGVAGLFKGGRTSRKLGNKFNRCVKSVRQTVRARPKSTKESAAIAICTKSVLQTRGLTMKRYKKKRLVTQKKFRGGCGGGKGWCS